MGTDATLSDGEDALSSHDKGAFSMQEMVFQPSQRPEAEELRGYIGRSVRVHGYVHKIRMMSGFAFVLLRTKRSVLQCLYVPLEAVFPLEEIREGDCVIAEGTLEAEERSRAGCELHLRHCRVLSRPAGEPAVVISGKDLLTSFDNRFACRALTLRHEKERAVFLVQNALTRGMRRFLQGQRFCEIHTPKIVQEGVEGGANLFAVDYFGRQAYLAQSPQAYKQMMVGPLERVFEIAPAYRAEQHDTSRHLSEFISVDLEMGFIDGFEDVMRMEAGMLEDAMACVREECGPELALLGASVPSPGAIPALRFDEGKRLAGVEGAERDDLSPEEERRIGAYAKAETGSDFVFVTHYPSAKRPFYAMDDPADERYTLSFDLLFRGEEITTGGQRIHDHAAQVRKMRRRGMDPAAFSHYLLAHHSGLPPHGGLGLGLERLTAQLLGLPNVRQACLFPRDQLRLVP